eukprot:2352381-Pyramimonas_sp.AAC.1
MLLWTCGAYATLEVWRPRSGNVESTLCSGGAGALRDRGSLRAGHVLRVYASVPCRLGTPPFGYGVHALTG